MRYKSFVVREVETGVFLGAVEELNTADLPAGDILINVTHSSLNFKDALSFSGNKGVTRLYPHTPGIDAVGVIAESNSAKFVVGQHVMVIGYDLGMNTSGGFGECIRVPANWVLTLPDGLSHINAMAFGTAGFTAALCVDKLLRVGLSPADGPVLVSGATGGVGSVAIRLLVKLGFEVHALSSKPDAEQYLNSIGAKLCIALDDFKLTHSKLLSKPFYAGAIDVAGGETLAAMLKVLKYQGSIACCGLVDNVTLNTTVLPFILRGVNLLGVDSVELPLEIKQDVWNKIAGEWSLPNLEVDFKLIDKSQLAQSLSLMLTGGNKGRFILQHLLVSP